jgi:hypothetical protein
MSNPLDKRFFEMYICAKKNTMSQSLSKLYVHIIFHVKNEQVFIRKEGEKEKALLIARKALNKGMTLEDVLELTGLTKEDLET